METDRTGFPVTAQAALITEHEIFGTFEVEGGGWRYLRLRFPGLAGAGSTGGNRLSAAGSGAMRELDPDYPDWMVTVTNKVS